MFKTFMGPVEDSAAVVYLRPETAQGIYVNFLNVQQATRQKVPFGIAQIGKAFRNEITPGNFIFRTREFEQMEMQFFVEPGTDMEWFEYWKARAHAVAPAGSGSPKSGCSSTSTPRTSSRTTRAPRSTSSSTSAARSASRRSRASTTAATSTSTQHQEYSGKKLEYFDQPTNKRFVPFVVETSVGAEPHDARAARERATARKRSRARRRGASCSGFIPSLAPIKAGVFPLVKKDGMPEMAHKIADELRRVVPGVLRRERRDRPALPPAGRGRHAVLHHGRRRVGRTATVTVRDRDTLQQERIAADALRDYIERRASPR